MTTKQKAAILMQVCARHFRLSAGEILGPSKYAEVVRARQMAMALGRGCFGWTFETLAEVFRRDVGTCRVAVDRWRRRAKADPDWHRLTLVLAMRMLEAIGPDWRVS